MPITYPTKVKANVIRRYEKGESIKALSEELHISQSTLYHWRRENCSTQTPNRTYTPAEFDAISRRLQKLEHEKEVIRRSGYLAKVPLQDKRKRQTSRRIASERQRGISSAESTDLCA